MNLLFNQADANRLSSGSQRARVMSEAWVEGNLYCVGCSAVRLQRLGANTKARDFICQECGEAFELKATKSKLANRIVGGAYAAMAERIAAQQAPNLLLLSYQPPQYAVRDLVVVPKHFLTLDSLYRRNPLGPQARRAGWVGCVILLDRIPASGHLYLVRDGLHEAPIKAREHWNRMLFLRKEAQDRSWLIAVLSCVERLPAEFTLAQAYAFEDELQRRFPKNTHVRPKIRQQLQRLRDSNQLAFLGGGRYRQLG